MRNLLLPALALLLAGCAQTGMTTGAVRQVSHGPRVLLMPVEDFKDAPGSGIKVRAEVLSEMAAHHMDVVEGAAASFDASYEEAIAKHCEDILRVQVSAWEDNATNWSGRLDVVEVVAEVRDPPTKASRGAIIRRQNDGRGNFIDHPNDILVPGAVENALASLYGWPTPPDR